jgi:hypothetical protein
MKNLIADLSIRKAALIVGIGFIIMFLLAIFADGFVLQNLVVTDDAATTADNIKADQLLFGLGIVGYIIILALDVIIALALYVILKPVNKSLSSFAAILRLLYTAIMGISLFALVLLFSNEYIYGKLIAYIFFILHIFVLGYLAFKSDYIHKILGVFLMIASICYIIILYGDYIFPKELFDAFFMIAIIPATFAELSLGIWLLLKRGKLPKIKNQDKTPT